MRTKDISFFSCLITFAALLFFATGCEGIPPTRTIPEEEQSPLFKAPQLLLTSEPDSEVTILPTQGLEQPINCTYGLTYIADLTFPDGTEVAPGATIDKQWKVKNTGTCNWDESYSLRFMTGDKMGADSPLALVPARNGSEAIISIKFTAPSEPNRYTSTWKAVGPDGQTFGESIYLEIIVVAP